jgi:hypothetical protein
MPVFQPSTGMPGMSAERIAKHRTVTADGYLSFLPGGVILSSVTRDPGNPDFAADGAVAQKRLRPGLMIGKVTATGEWANSILGVTAGAYTSGGTSLTVSAAQAAEIIRRVGTSGNLTYIGPPSAAGTVAVTGPIAYSAVNPTTGIVTTATLGVNKIAGTWVVAGDGSEVMRSFLPDGWEIPMPDTDVDMPLDKLPIAGNIDGSKLIDWPTDTSLQAYIRASFNEFGKFVFVERYAP